jgi:hypothetical protein
MHRTISSWQCQFLPRVVAAAKNTTMAALAVTLLRRPPEPPQIFKHWHGDRRGLPRQTAPGQGQSITAPLTRSKPCSAPPQTPTVGPRASGHSHLQSFCHCACEPCKHGRKHIEAAGAPEDEAPATRAAITGSQASWFGCAHRRRRAPDFCWAFVPTTLAFWRQCHGGGPCGGAGRGACEPGASSLAWGMF